MQSRLLRAERAQYHRILVSIRVQLLEVKKCASKDAVKGYCIVNHGQASRGEEIYVDEIEVGRSVPHLSRQWQPWAQHWAQRRILLEFCLVRIASVGSRCRLATGRRNRSMCSGSIDLPCPLNVCTEAAVRICQWCDTKPLRLVRWFSSKWTANMKLLLYGLRILRISDGATIYEHEQATEPDRGVLRILKWKTLRKNRDWHSYLDKHNRWQGREHQPQSTTKWVVWPGKYIGIPRRKHGTMNLDQSPIFGTVIPVAGDSYVREVNPMKLDPLSYFIIAFMLQGQITPCTVTFKHNACVSCVGWCNFEEKRSISGLQRYHCGGS